MRILVVALGGAGHSFPLVPLALALRDAGHEITFGTSADAPDIGAATGLGVAVLGLPMREAFARASVRLGITGTPTDPAGIAVLAGEAFGVDMPRGFAADVGAWIDAHHPDLVIAEVGCPGAAIAAVRAGTPCVSHSFGRRPESDSPIGREITTRLVALFEEFELGPVRPGEVLGHAYLDVCPPSLQSPRIGGGRELPLRPTPWNPPVPAFVPRTHDRPWVYVTLGTAMGDAAVLRAAVAGLAGLGVDVVVATGSVDVGELAGLGPTVAVEPFVPQADLLGGRLGPPPALVVHHGGSGTTLAVARAGVPHVVLPQGADQFTNASALVEAGVATALAGPDGTPAAVTPAEITEAAGALLGAGPARAAARALAAEVAAMPSPDDVAADVARWSVPQQ